MFIVKYALPLASALLLVLFFMGLPLLSECRLPGSERDRMCRADWLSLALITILYAVLSLWNLGDTAAPQTFTAMSGEAAVLRLESDDAPARILLYPGVGTGSYEIEYSEDGLNYVHALRFDQGHVEVLKWHFLTPETELRPAYVRISCTTGTPWLGELVLLDGDGHPIPVDSSLPALCDEWNLAPVEESFLNSTYFDEIYHARTAWEHLNGIWPYEISHPPLGKLIIGLGIRLFGMTPFGWRFMGALFGAMMLPVLYLFLKKLFGGLAVPTLGTLLMASDFMHYVQTRIATIDTYAVFFILLMYLFMYLYLSRERLRDLALCGLFFGLGAASKWTCIYAGGGLAVLWAAHWIRKARERDLPGGFGAFLRNCLFCLLFFVLVPGLIYYLSYLPYGQAESAPVFSARYTRLVLDNQSFMFNYHVGVVAEHPYASRWYQWMLDIRPILYYLHYFDNGTRSSICAFLNPALCWGGLLSLFVLLYTAIFRMDRKAGFLLVGYLAQLLPWIFIRRLTFEYHYFPASVFLLLAICYVFSLMRENRRRWFISALSFTLVSILLFVMFFPVLSGLPVDNAMASRFLGWLPTWPL